MADLEQERVTALWREAADTLGEAELTPAADDLLTMHWFDGGLTAESRNHRPDCPACEIDCLRAECGRLREAFQTYVDATTFVSSLPLDDGCPNAPSMKAWTAARAALGVEGKQANEKPDGWPEKCGSCGASWEHIGFDAADGFNCRMCGRCESDE
jgi:hypothetical protein